MYFFGFVFTSFSVNSIYPREKRNAESLINTGASLGGTVGGLVGGGLGGAIGSAVGGLVGGILCIFICHDGEEIVHFIHSCKFSQSCYVQSVCSDCSVI